MGDFDTGEAIVIDPGDEGDRIINELSKQSFLVKYILHTHAHIDHIGATKKVKEATGGKIGLHKDDLFLYENLKMQSDMLGMRVDPEVKPVDHYLIDGDKIEWGKEVRTEVLHTPGHTPGSLSFYFSKLIKGQDVLFTGDTLFMGSIGRTDLWGGDYDQIMHSIKTKLITYNPNTIVVCGHGPNTTIGQETKMNPFLN